jgi:hypothetical protein
VAALRLGDAALAFLPGEPFAETGIALREASPFTVTAIVGCSEASIGYIPTDEAFAEGGYETGFGRWSVLAPGSEGVLRRTAEHLLVELGEKGCRGDGRQGPPAPRTVGQSPTQSNGQTSVDIVRPSAGRGT